MKRELDFPKIDGQYYGGDQNWHTHPMMKLGGCSAVCACEACIYLAKEFPQYKGLYPYDPQNVTKEDFLRFFETVYQYIHPGIGGLTSIDKFEKMFQKYIATTRVDMKLRKLPGCDPLGDARDFVTKSIDAGLPVMYLMLKHADPAFDEYEWHWFNLTGYELSEDKMQVSFATWGSRHEFDFLRAWDTQKCWRGGMLSIEI
ncbi:MAG: hypothetical protein VB081_10425 [Christensenella sp.]|uniref:hypothetical protein n=1 Tax=Christensenella sp. TaxID=1935934 RepID=UPI002B1FE5AA|nr:hypothetical protein [Christensenella sp.]MEA5003902.1 hypothetical protein [Christensenella sp.]